jgi:hypothetical protein
MTTRDQVRSGQLVTTFGPGAMIDFPRDSVIVAGLDHWRYRDVAAAVVDEPRLLEKLRRVLDQPDLTLRRPPACSDDPREMGPCIKGWRFPVWFIVQRNETGRGGIRRRRLVHLDRLHNGRYKDRDTKTTDVVPVRWVRACPRGHVGDVDWKAVVHGQGSTCGGDLWVEERGTSGDLADITISCDCGQTRRMSQAAQMKLKVLGNCNGSRPWLGRGTKEGCGQPNRLLIRSASNAYFPQHMAVISIPDAADAIDQAVRDLWDNFFSDVESPDELPKVLKKPLVAARLAGVSIDQVWRACARRKAGNTGEIRPVKEAEFDALSEALDELGSDAPGGNFYARTLPKDRWSKPWMGMIERVVLVHRLREVSAQVGFTRFEAAGPDIQGELSLDVETAKLSIDARWLPAVENRGEGIFLQFRATDIKNWLGRAATKERGTRLMEGFKAWEGEHPKSIRQFPGLPYYLLHSVSHVVLSAVALECGYPASSLRERVYAMNGRYGILIYTGSPDAEGTLGGLVLAGRDIARHVRRALESASLCSNDPVCAFHVPADHDHQPLLGSACHGCILLPETCCEQRNDFLDRSLVVSTVEGIDAEFFTAERG